MPPAPAADLAPFAATLRVEPGSTMDLESIDPDGTPGFDGDKDAAEDEVKTLRDELTDFQERLWAEKGQSLLIVLQALDGGGKDGTIRKVFTAFNPQGTRVTGFGVPSEEELAHDFLWRIHPHAPGKGRIGIFNRSHYEDVLVVRVNELAPKSVWSGRYELINAFEQSLAAARTTILKFMLHISRDEQRQRFEDRLAEPAKRWKFRLADLEARARWADYMAAYTDVLERCSTPHAPWFVIPADHKWYRDLAVARIVTDAARRMNPQYPEPEEDLSGVVVTS
ncbi:MAG TPA: polyphosphate kinase 2 family protein [Candidatus Limnocylindria bacterium]|nr:polyphosphate kinase 2 family protein [Candidatus Limnocylindria bacterium]